MKRRVFHLGAWLLLSAGMMSCAQDAASTRTGGSTATHRAEGRSSEFPEPNQQAGIAASPRPESADAGPESTGSSRLGPQQPAMTGRQPSGPSGVSGSAGTSGPSSGSTSIGIR